MARPGIHQSSPIAVADWAASAGWGSTASITAVASGSTDIGGQVTVQCNGSGIGANPTLTLTFRDGAFPVAPVAVVCRASGAAPATAFLFWGTTTTTLILTFAGTPVAGNFYDFSWILCGGAT
jgi:hypothetical protein